MNVRSDVELAQVISEKDAANSKITIEIGDKLHIK